MSRLFRAVVVFAGIAGALSAGACGSFGNAEVADDGGAGDAGPSDAAPAADVAQPPELDATTDAITDASASFCQKKAYVRCADFDTTGSPWGFDQVDHADGGAAALTAGAVTDPPSPPFALQATIGKNGGRALLVAEVPIDPSLNKVVHVELDVRVVAATPLPVELTTLRFGDLAAMTLGLRDHDLYIATPNGAPGPPSVLATLGTGWSHVAYDYELTDGTVTFVVDGVTVPAISGGRHSPEPFVMVLTLCVDAPNLDGLVEDDFDDFVVTLP